jgi:hypothetical protein
VVVACFVIQQLEIQQTKFVTTKECTFGAPFDAFGRVLKSSQVQKTYMVLKDKPHFSNTKTYMCNTQVAMG